MAKTAPPSKSAPPALNVPKLSTRPWRLPIKVGCAAGGAGAAFVFGGGADRQCAGHRIKSLQFFGPGRWRRQGQLPHRPIGLNVADISAHRIKRPAGETHPLARMNHHIRRQDLQESRIGRAGGALSRRPRNRIGADLRMRGADTEHLVGAVQKICPSETATEPKMTYSRPGLSSRSTWLRISNFLSPGRRIHIRPLASGK